MISEKLIKSQGISESKGTLLNYYIASTGAVILWSASFIATKLAYKTFAPIQLGIVRTFLAAVLFAIIRSISKAKEKIKKKDRILVIASGFFGITLYFTIENIGVSMTTSSNAALIVASFPAITTALEFLIYNLKPTLKKVFGIVIALIGVAVLTQITSNNTSKSLYGNLILISAGLVWALYNFITRKLSNRYSALTLTYYQMLYATVLFIPFVLLEDKPWKLPNITSASALLYLSIGCSVGAFMLYNLGLKKLSASVAVSLMNLVPVLGLILSVFILAEKVSLIQVLGGVTVIIGVILSSIKDYKD